MFHHKSEGLHPSVKSMWRALYYFHVKKQVIFPPPCRWSDISSLIRNVTGSFQCLKGIWIWYRCWNQLKQMRGYMLGGRLYSNNYVWQALVLSAQLGQNLNACCSTLVVWPEYVACKECDDTCKDRGQGSGSRKAVTQVLIAARLACWPFLHVPFPPCHVVILFFHWAAVQSRSSPSSVALLGLWGASGQTGRGNRARQIIDGTH